MNLLYAVILVLSAAWVLWFWVVAESRNFRLVQVWCARTFVALAALFCIAAGAWFARRQSEAAHRDHVTKLMVLLHERMQSGQVGDVADALKHVAETPDEWSLHRADILARIDEVTEALEKSSRAKVAVRDEAAEAARQ